MLVLVLEGLGRENKWGRTEVGEPDNEVGEHECGCTVEAVGTLFDECCAIFEEGGNIGHCHEGHECATEELSPLVSVTSQFLVGRRLAIALMNG